LEENEYREMLSVFRRELEKYVTDTLEKLYKGEKEIKGLENVLLKRKTGYSVNHKGKSAFKYYFALNPVYRDFLVTQYHNESEQAAAQIIFEDDLLAKELTVYIEKSYRIILVSDRLRFSDGSQISVGEIFMTIFCYYYRKMDSLIYAIHRAEEILGNPEFLAVPFNADYDIVEYLFKEEMGII